MTQFLELVFVGLGTGATYTLLAQGVLVGYVGSGVLNFAQGAIAMVGGFIYYQFAVELEWNFWPAFVLATLAGGVIGALMYLIPMRAMRNSATLARVIVTLGVLITLAAAMTLLFGTQGKFVPSFLPSDQVSIAGVPANESDLILVGIALALTLGLWLLYRFTTIGLATRAAATNPLAASALGWSPDVLGVINWTFGCALGAAAGVMLAPLTGLQPSITSLVVIVALAAVLVGRFSSLPLTLVGAMAIGVAQAEVGNYVHQQGAADALPFAVLVIALVIWGRGLPARDFVIERFSEVGSGRVRWRAFIPALAAVTAMVIFVFSANLNSALATSLEYGVIMLSIVVLTGYAGQLSLAQAALGGIGALVAGRLVAAQGWPFELALLAAALGSVGAGLVFAIPALRTRGVNLAVVTLGLGLALQSMLFTNISFTGGVDGTNVSGQTFLGIDVDPVEHPASYTVLVLAWFVILALMVGNLRRGRAGRRLLAARANERAAAALGISVVGAKLYAFAVSAGIAGIGGALLAFQNQTINWDAFDPFTSILLVAYAVIGGIGFLLGPLWGSLLVVGGIGAFGSSQLLPDLTDWLGLLGGIWVIHTLCVAPNGIAEKSSALTSAAGRFRRSAPRRSPEPLISGERRRVAPTTLAVSDLVIRFGGVTAVDGVSLTVEPGQIVGLIGPNGAGKTTLIDAVTGFVTRSEGEVRLNGQRIDGWSASRRARTGISRSFQSLELFEDVTVLDNLRAASDTRDTLAYLTNLLSPGNRPLGPEVVAAIHDFGLESDLHQRPSDISYGRRRLVAVARAVASHPSILLLDEPAAGLSDVESQELALLVRRFADEWGMGILLVEHDLAFVMNVCDDITVLDFGRCIAQGPPDVVRNDPAVVAAYIGEADVDPVARA